MTQPIYILAIDTSCDDTAVAVLKNDFVLSNIVSSQVEIHNTWGGVVPSLAKRAHIEKIQPCIDLAIKRARIKQQNLDAIAVTYGPGLAPSLEVGIEAAKKLAINLDKPLIAVNHMEGHVLSPLLKNRCGNFYLRNNNFQLPLLAMSISGGHTEIVWVEKIGSYKIVGQTVDDAAGEAFDKVARMLELGYPGGPIVEHLAQQGNAAKYPLPRPMSNSNNYDFSFSGLKTAALYMLKGLREEHKDNFAEIIPDFCASLQEAVVDSLLIKLKKAVKNFQPKTVFVAGGVSANKRLRHKFRQQLKQYSIPVIFPAKKFCMDNASMIGITAYFKFLRQEFVIDKLQLDREPSISIESVNRFEAAKP